MANATNIKQDEHDDIPNEITLPFLLFKDETLQRAEESDKILKIQVILVMNACNIHLLGSIFQPKTKIHFDNL